uniref:Uncharacterized protein n=1 Tax=Rhizophora mucronata TaxID=61149 RepID=A0A2P2NK32_RHIMU
MTVEIAQYKSGVGIQHRFTKEDAMRWFQDKYP